MALTVVDASVVIGVLDASDPHHAAAVTALREARERGEQLILPASCYTEVLVQPMRHGADSIIAVDSAIEALGLRVEPTSAGIALRAAVLRARHDGALGLPDAFVIATAEVVRARRLLTSSPAIGRASPLAVLVA